MPLAIPKRLQGKTPAHARSVVQEKAAAKRLGGQRQKGSGSGDERGDVRLRGFVRLEAKTTAATSFRVTKEIIDKLEAAVVGTGEVPIIEVELELGRRKCHILPDWALDLVTEAIERGRAKG